MPRAYEYKVRLNGWWTETTATPLGVADGEHPAVVSKPTTLRFTYDDATHRLRVGPATPAGGTDPGRLPSPATACART